ncbi:MAG: glycosyltransferase [Thermodesulfobacteriota bacterium]|nr:glycosyltransferase [Thermodesulfobacteriota bacterium]
MNSNSGSNSGNILDESNMRVFTNQSGEKNLQLLGEKEKWITFYSHRDISRELRFFSRNVDIPENHIIVLLGLGLGYHLKEILKKTSLPVIIVEVDEEVAKAALLIDGVADVLNGPQTHSVVGMGAEGSLKEISRIQLRHGLKDIFVVKHPPSIRSFPSFYHPIIARLEKASRARIGSQLRYGKFEHERLNILLINSQYLLMQEIVNASEALGHHIKSIIIERKAEVARNEFVEKLLRVLIEFKPDFVLTTNHLGFDREGILTDLLTTLEIPFASWYVDSPMLIIKHYERNISPYCAIFLWDEDYISDIRALGFDNIHYLPLATDTHIFRPVAKRKNPLSSQANQISFVGNSMVNKVRQKLDRMKIPVEYEGMVEEIGRAFADSTFRNVSEILDKRPYSEHTFINEMHDGKRIDFEALIMWQATLIHRLRNVEMLAPFGAVIRGDQGWHTLLNGSYQIGPELSYYSDLSFFYNVSEINFNVTSTQMRNAINQRVFDVPASGRFLLTDYKGQLEELFAIGDEIICYREKEEIPELVKFYLDHDTLRRKIAERGRRRVLNEHLYSHRVKEMCDYMKKHFA